MDIVSELYQLLEQDLSKMGYEIIRIKIIGGNPQTLQIMLDRIDQEDITIDDCERVSKYISRILDVEDIISDKYNLEVSSPGIDRPLTRIKDFARFIPFEAKVKTHNKVMDRRSFKGRLKGVEGEVITITDEELKQDVEIEFSNIESAKLVLNDELMKATNKLD